MAPPDDEFTGNDASEEIPDWLSDGDLDSDDAIAWLEEIAAKYDPNFETSAQADDEVEEEAPEEAAEPALETPDSEPGLPGWLTADTPTEPVVKRPEPAAVTAPASGIDEDEDSLPAWLKDTTEAELPEADTEEVQPDWLKTGPPPTAEKPPEPSPEEEKEAMGWLDEQVEAQGVSADEVVSEALTPDSPPTKYPDLPPLDAQAEALTDDELPDWLKESEAREAIADALDEEPDELEIEQMPELEAEEDELAWLKSALDEEEEPLTLEDLFDEEEEEEEEKAPELVAEALSIGEEEDEEDEEDLPDWLQGFEDQPTLSWHTLDEPEAEPAETKADKEPETLPEIETPVLEVSEEDSLPDWLTGMDAPAVTEGAEPSDELPDWLTGTVEEAKFTEEEPEVEEAVSEEEPEEEIEPEPVAEAISEEPAEEEAPELEEEIELEPVAEAISEEPAEEEAPEPEEEVEPEPVAEAISEEPAEEEAPELEEEIEPEPVAEAVSEEPAVVTPTGDSHEQLAAAREKLSAKDYDGALPYYESLIAQEEMLEQTVADLDYAIKTEARISPRVRRVLGDALRAQGRLQEALEAYRSALDEL